MYPMSASKTLDISKFSSEAKLGSRTSTFPSTYWLLVVNVLGPGSVAIVVPQAGNLWVFFEIGSGTPQPAVMEVWHQGGSTTPIQLGENVIPVGYSDMILYQLVNPASDTIKLAYQIQ